MKEPSTVNGGQQGLHLKDSFQKLTSPVFAHMCTTFMLSTIVMLLDYLFAQGPSQPGP